MSQSLSIVPLNFVNFVLSFHSVIEEAVQDAHIWRVPHRPSSRNSVGLPRGPFSILTSTTVDQQKSQSMKSKKSTLQEATTPANHQPLSLDKQVQLEQLTHSNLQLQWEITRVQLELAKLSPNFKPSQAISSIKPEVTTKPRSIGRGQKCHNSQGLVGQRYQRAQHPSLLSNDYLFSAKG